MPGWLCSWERLLAGILGLGWVSPLSERSLQGCSWWGPGAGLADGVAFPGEPTLPRGARAKSPQHYTNTHVSALGKLRQQLLSHHGLQAG